MVYAAMIKACSEGMRDHGYQILLCETGLGLESEHSLISILLSRRDVARGLAVPSEIALVGFGDQDFAADVIPSITTVRVDRQALGIVAARAILSRIDGAGTAETPISDIGFEIVRRGSA